jgi:hypothetical protein
MLFSADYKKMSYTEYMDVAFDHYGLVIGKRGAGIQ